MRKLASTLLAGAVVSLVSNDALANTKAPSGGAHPRPPMGGAGQPHSGPYAGHSANSPWKQNCYWLPTVSNGSVSGLQQVCNWVKK